MANNRYKVYARLEGPHGWVLLYDRKRDAIKGDMGDSILHVFPGELGLSYGDFQLNTIYSLSVSLKKIGGVIDTVS